MQRVICFLIFSFIVQKTNAQSFADKLLADSSITGLQINYSKKGKITAINAGFSDSETKQKVSSKTIFQAASLSKVVLAYICLELANKKQIDLDKPLISYYDYPRLKNDSAAKKITARMVLMHTSGLPNWTENPLKKSWATSALSTSFEPGNHWKYSGEGFVFLQLVIQNILKKDLQQIADEMVFKPLAMNNSSFIWKDEFESVAALGHDDKSEQTQQMPFFLPNAAFSLLTTASDYQTFLNAFYHKFLPKIISDSVSIYDTKEPKSSAKSLFWGLGMGIQENELGKMLWHWGDNGDFQSFFMIDPRKDEILVCFTNSANGLKIMKPVLSHFFGTTNWPAASWLGN
ncbi:serine hydrolase domain-containing protein [Pedobacter mendelii]|uniref:Serine hydrolase n=1 Tax=Pedobacter mendelii TaxID=1908240 RepID=A0ABQ2BDW6_9SPHI|nr:serine hydrolase domain-containing protein [Pedobacter mendelii]GGI22579.1 serine hydrolase [Pedobacter mendelii]